MTRRAMTRRRRVVNRTILQTRAPRKGTVVIAGILYVGGLFGYLGWLPLGADLSVGALALAGLLLLLGALLRDL